MKTRIVAPLLLLICTAIPVFAQSEEKDIIRRVCVSYDIKREGYRTTGEYHSTNDHYHELHCVEPGEKKCDWVRNPLPHWPTGRVYAENQISNGILTGYYQEIQGNILFEVTWSVTPEKTEIIQTESEIPVVE